MCALPIYWQLNPVFSLYPGSGWLRLWPVNPLKTNPLLYFDPGFVQPVGLRRCRYHKKPDKEINQNQVDQACAHQVLLAKPIPAATRPDGLNPSHVTTPLGFG